MAGFLYLLAVRMKMWNGKWNGNFEECTAQALFLPNVRKEYIISARKYKIPLYSSLQSPCLCNLHFSVMRGSDCAYYTFFMATATPQLNALQNRWIDTPWDTLYLLFNFFPPNFPLPNKVMYDDFLTRQEYKHNWFTAFEGTTQGVKKYYSRGNNDPKSCGQYCGLYIFEQFSPVGPNMCRVRYTKLITCGTLDQWTIILSSNTFSLSKIYLYLIFP